MIVYMNNNKIKAAYTRSSIVTLKLKLELIEDKMDTTWLIIELTLVIIAECNQDGIPVTVSRRSSGDSYVTNNSSDSDSEGLCSVHDGTYLVSERQCVNNQELLSGMKFV